MPRAPPPFMILLSAVALFVWYIVWTRDHERPIAGLSFADRFQQKLGHHQPQSSHADIPAVTATPSVLHGEHVMPTLGNETLKAELGRAAWKVLHTTMAHFPDTPTQDESDALKSYIYLFARLYPCGECAEHFQSILKKYPPQTGSRSSAAAWACFVHNVVNESKGKEVFDCANFGDFYDCGCADEQKEEMNKHGKISDVIAKDGRRKEV